MRASIRCCLLTCSTQIDANGRAKLADFGLSKCTNKDIAKTLAGTPCYIAPEVQTVTNVGTYNESVDIFSFGVLLWELLHSPQRVFDLKLNFLAGQRPPIDSKIDSELEKLIKRAWSVAPARRPTAHDCAVQICLVLNRPAPGKNLRAKSVVDSAADEKDEAELEPKTPNTPAGKTPSDSPPSAPSVGGGSFSSSTFTLYGGDASSASNQ